MDPLEPVVEGVKSHGLKWDFDPGPDVDEVQDEVPGSRRDDPDVLPSSFPFL